MDHFHYTDGALHAEAVPLARIAEAVGTPVYVYSRATLERHWRVFDAAFGDYPHLVCYAVKANSNLAVLNLFARRSSGFDVVSAGELERVLRAGGDPARIVFSGVGKQVHEIERALAAGILSINAESLDELTRIDAVAGRLGRIAPVSVRVNPDIDARTHPYIATGLKENKFGITIDDALAAYRHAHALPHLRIVGVACHIGSQLTDITPYLETLDRLLDFIAVLEREGIAIEHLDLGGGLGVRYADESPPAPRDYVAAVLARIRQRHQTLPLHVEPGRAIAANAGVLLTRVEYLKLAAAHNFAIVDAAMNDLIRPALYQAWHTIVSVAQHSTAPVRRYDVVGPVCESADFLGKGRELAIAAGDLLAVRTAGAYGAVLSSNYNSRPRAPEVLVDGESFQIVRRRETLNDMLAFESLPPQELA